jgi:Icc-related predicted phosphoesterase
MKILLIGDLHGRKPILRFKDFDCIVQVGDVGDDSKLGPLYKKYFKLLKKDENSKLSWEQFVKKEIGVKKYDQYERESLKKGNEIMKYIDSFGKPIFMVAGNWDQSYGPTKIKDIEKSNYHYRKAFFDWYLGDKINPGLLKGTKNVHDCMHRNHEFKGINFVGYGNSSGRELMRARSKKLKVTKKQYEILKKAQKKVIDKLFNAYRSRKNKKLPTIFISHNIPYKTKLDKGKDKKSYAYGLHLGSSIARKFCEKYQPLLCVGGHVHEGVGKDKIGETIVINSGFGKNAQVLIDIDEKKGKIRKIQFYKKKK